MQNMHAECALILLHAPALRCTTSVVVGWDDGGILFFEALAAAAMALAFLVPVALPGGGTYVGAVRNLEEDGVAPETTEENDSCGC